jgi:hypothetical protein
MKKKMLIVAEVFFITFVVTLTILASPAQAQSTRVEGAAGVSLDVETILPKTIGANTSRSTVFSAKFLCGRIRDRAENESRADDSTAPLARGTYFTAINVRNPNPFSLKFIKKTVETRSQGEPRGEVGTGVTEALAADQGIEIDCKDIRTLLGSSLAERDSSDFVKGFVVITIPGLPDVLFDVVGVYAVESSFDDNRREKR